MRRRVRKSCGVSPKVARKGDGNETLKGRPRAPPARAEHGIGIRRRASHVRDTADGTCRHEEVAARENDTSLSAAPSAIWSQRRAEIEGSAGGVLGVWGRNIFPEMKVTWAAYPNDLGHMDFPGCFRCHDGSHTSADGQTITNDCSACHQFLATGEENPKILTDLGMK